jgi:hypothetical protein
MKPIVEKVLSSGLVDKATAQLMEQWGYLPEGSADKVNEDKLKNATQETLTKLANDLATEVEKEHALRETYLDLERLRWPVSNISISKPSGVAGESISLADKLVAVVDRMGRYFFRIQDVKQEWFVPGYYLVRESGEEKILQAQVLYVGEQGVCIQVTTDKSA